MTNEHRKSQEPPRPVVPETNDYDTVAGAVRQNLVYVTQQTTSERARPYLDAAESALDQHLRSLELKEFVESRHWIVELMLNIAVAKANLPRRAV